MFEESEILTFILGCLSFAVIIAAIGMPRDGAVRCFVFGVLAILGSYLCTNLEVLLAAHLMDFCEHLLFAIAAGLFLVAAVKIGRRPEHLTDE